MHTSSILQTLFCILICFGIVTGDTFKIYGLDYTARRISYCPSQDQVNQDMQIINSRAYYVRLYSLVDCNQGAMVLEAIKQLNLPLRVTLGIWVDGPYHDVEFPNEYAALVNVNNAYGLSKVDSIIVGSETQYRGDFSVDLLIYYINNISTTIKQNFGYTQIQITTADVIDSIRGLPQLVATVDYVTYNQFAYWENIAIDDAISRTEFRYNDFVSSGAAQGKKIVISEVGWPTEGENEGNAVPTPANANKFFHQIVCWAAQNDVQLYYFAAFDSLWQQDDDQKHWGLYNEDRSLKTGIDFDFPCSAPANGNGVTTGAQATPNPTRATTGATKATTSTKATTATTATATTGVTKATTATTGTVNKASTNKATTTGKVSTNRATTTAKVASTSTAKASTLSRTTTTKATSATTGSAATTGSFATCPACGAAACCQQASGPACYDPKCYSCPSGVLLQTGNC